MRNIIFQKNKYNVKIRNLNSTIYNKTNQINNTL